jgi:hypothetical protein
LRPELERVRSLAGLDFGEFSDDLEPVRLGKPLQRLTLGFNPEAQSLFVV